MPTQKDLKRLVRARMRKTGEAYTAARAQITSKAGHRDVRTSGSRADVSIVTTDTAKPDYAALAGMADDKVKKATGCTWEKWVFSLDRKKAYELSHRDLAKLIKEKYKTPDWWTQTVAVGYERIKGKRSIGQRVDGRFHASKSRTFNVPIERLFDAWTDTKTRERWLAAKNVKIRKATAFKSIRLEQDGSIIAVLFTKKGPAKSIVAIDEDKLPSRDAAAEVKKYWGERFDELAAVLSG
jgi:hypothetical protein